MRAFVQAIGSEKDKKHRVENPSGGLLHFGVRFAEAKSREEKERAGAEIMNAKAKP